MESCIISYIVGGKMEKAEVTETVARKLLAEWVHRLHLEDWRIDLKWNERVKDMCDDQFCMGVTYSNFSVGEAEIRMATAEDKSLFEYEYDYEKTLVHELLHLKFAALDDTGDALRDKLTHRMIDDMAHALVDAKRSGYEEGF